MKKSSLLIAVILLAALVGGGFFYFRDMDGPKISLTPDSGPVSRQHPPVLQLSDLGSGLRSVDVSLIQGDKTIPRNNFV